jgi:hypothetical protein
LDLFGALFPGMDEGFGFDAEGIGDAIDVIKIANYLGGVVDAVIIEAVAAQHIEVGGAHLLGGFGELLGVGTERYIGSRQIGFAPITTNVMHQQIGLGFVGNPKIFGDLSTEVMRMRPSSVEAVIDGRGDRGQHFALTA